MKIIKKTSKRILTITILVAVAACAVLIYIVPLDGSIFGWKLSSETSTPSDVNEVNLKKPTAEEIKTGIDIKKESVDTEQNKNKPGSEESIKPHDTSVSITASNVHEGTLQIRALISSLISDASCNLELQQGSTLKRFSSGTQNLASSATCQGFNIPTSELGVGEWVFTLSVSSDGATIGTANGKVSL